MRERPWQVGVCGTFDIANYGDLLFPFIAEAELSERLGAVSLHRFSYAAKAPPDWPYVTTSVTALPEVVGGLDGFLIGGGFIVRFDKNVAPGYAPPTAEIHHPTGYWLTPALVALQHDVPLMWNAPGMHCNEIPTWAQPLVTMVMKQSRYVSVRDEPSRSALEHLAGVPVCVVPDTAFRIRRLLDLEGEPTAEFTRLCRVSGLDGPYIVIQATLGVEDFARFVKDHAERFRGFRFLALPIGPALGEHSAIVDADLPGLVQLLEWPDPLVIAELIGRSEAVVGHSYHLFITALACGVPAFTRQNLSTGKYSALGRFETLFSLPRDGELTPDWFLQRVGRTAPSAAARATDEPLTQHWDRIAAAIRGPATSTAPTLDRFWQCLPGLLEDADARASDARELLAGALDQTAEAEARLDEALRSLDIARHEAAETERHLESSLRLVALAREDTAARDRRIAELIASTSWKVTAPLRFLSNRLRRRS